MQLRHVKMRLRGMLQNFRSRSFAPVLFAKFNTTSSFDGVNSGRNCERLCASNDCLSAIQVANDCEPNLIFCASFQLYLLPNSYTWTEAYAG
jgi:hypothetical protein